MIAIDKSNGEKIWESDGVGEEFSTIPVEFDGVIYTMGIASSTVFAISFDDGSLIGTANLESDSPFGGSFESIYSLKDGIIFNTRNLVVIYKIK
jgi:outer membrane protein assembly factor BamB